jgi:hypothetical protein
MPMENGHAPLSVVCLLHIHRFAMFCVNMCPFFYFLNCHHQRKMPMKYEVAVRKFVVKLVTIKKQKVNNQGCANYGAPYGVNFSIL